MKLFLDEMLTDVDASLIPISEKHPLSLDRIIQNTISNCEDSSRAPNHFRRHLHLSLAAAILVGLLAIGALATPLIGHLKTVQIEYPVSDDGNIVSPELPDLGIALSVAQASPIGLELTVSVETVKNNASISAGSDYYLEMQKGDSWMVVPMLSEHQWQWDSRKIDADPHTWQIDWTGIYGVLAPGSYRIQKSFTVTSDDGAAKTYFIGESFIIEG